VLSHGEVTGSGKNKLSFDQVAIDRATAYSPKMPMLPEAVAVLKPRLVAERIDRGV